MSRGDEMIEDGKFHLILEFVHYIFQIVLVRQCVGNCGTLFVDVCFCDAYAIEEFWQNDRPVPPCIMMTAANMDAGELKKSGFDGYLAKPMERQSLLLILKKFEEGGRG